MAVNDQHSVTASELKELSSYLTAQERAELDRLLNPSQMWTPHSEPQWMAYESEADELLYGGAAGGGKTDLLIGVALNLHIRSLIFRRELTDVDDMVDRSMEIINDRKRWNANKHVWSLPHGRAIRFGAMQHEKDWEKWRGRARDFYGFDELTQFTEMQYRNPISWNRSTIPGQRCRVVAASNPPTNADGEWVIRYWGAWLDDQHPHPARPGELRWYTSIEGKDRECENNTPIKLPTGETVKPRSRTFIPAKLSDNPFLKDTDYAARVAAAPEPLRSQLLYGDWKAGRKDDPWQCIPTRWVELAIKRWRDMQPPASPMTCAAVDVARGGDDKTVLAKRFDHYVAGLVKMPGSDTPNATPVVNLIAAHMTGDAPVAIDVIGVGASVYDQSRINLTGRRVVAINFAEGSHARDRSQKFRMINKRAEAYWKLREALDPDYGANLALPDDPELKADLCAPRWELTAQGIKIESKDDIKKRIGRSPDCGDAVAMTMVTSNVSDVLFAFK